MCNYTLLTNFKDLLGTGGCLKFTNPSTRYDDTLHNWKSTQASRLRNTGVGGQSETREARKTASFSRRTQGINRLRGFTKLVVSAILMAGGALRLSKSPPNQETHYVSYSLSLSL